MATKRADIQLFSAVIDGYKYNFKCWTTYGYEGPVHTAKSLDHPVTNTRVSWCGRTWEAFTYEKVLRRAIKKFPEAIRPELLAQIVEKKEAEDRARADEEFNRFKAAHDRLTPEQKKHLAESDITIQSEDDIRAVTGLMFLMSL